MNLKDKKHSVLRCCTYLLMAMMISSLALGANDDIDDNSFKIL